ncbi:MAG: putative nucleic-acid-binding protein [Polaribacter sp.]
MCFSREFGRSCLGFRVLLRSTKPSHYAYFGVLLNTTQLAIENSEVIHICINRFRKGNADFNDAIIAVIAEDAGCERIFTFDKKSKSVGMTLLS